MTTLPMSDDVVEQATKLIDDNFMFGDIPHTRKRAIDLFAEKLREIAKLRAIASPAAAQDVWRPIETAPRDGTRILLYAEDWVAWPVTGSWCERVAAWDTEIAMMEDVGRDEIRPDECAGPSHWQPLPAPPARAALQAAREKGV